MCTHGLVTFAYGTPVFFFHLTNNILTFSSLHGIGFHSVSTHFASSSQLGFYYLRQTFRLLFKHAVNNCVPCREGTSGTGTHDGVKSCTIIIITHSYHYYLFIFLCTCFLTQSSILLSIVAVDISMVSQVTPGVVRHGIGTAPPELGTDFMSPSAIFYMLGGVHIAMSPGVW